MIGTLPMKDLAPLEYRHALDAAATFLNADEPPFIRCESPYLRGEVHQRFAEPAAVSPTLSALWVEPRKDSWQSELRQLREILLPAGTLVIIISRSWARLLHERRDWEKIGLGDTHSGVANLCRELHKSGFLITGAYGIHAIKAIVLNLLSQIAARAGRPALSDRLHFAARLNYCTEGRFALLATVALIVAQRGSA